MRAISFHESLPAENPVSLVDVTVDEPKPGPRDIRVEVRAISVNPVDTKVRIITRFCRRSRAAPHGHHRLGIDF
jgi:NADPH:quinone reductase-like Zn-dependent oxidoreductase